MKTNEPVLHQDETVSLFRFIVSDRNRDHQHSGQIAFGEPLFEGYDENAIEIN